MPIETISELGVRLIITRVHDPECSSSSVLDIGDFLEELARKSAAPGSDTNVHVGFAVLDGLKYEAEATLVATLHHMRQDHLFQTHVVVHRVNIEELTKSLLEELGKEVKRLKLGAKSNDTPSGVT